MAGLLHGQYLKFWQRISPVVVASDVLAGFYIKYCPGIVFVMARPFFITSEGRNLHNVPGYCWAIPVVGVIKQSPEVKSNVHGPTVMQIPNSHDTREM